MILGKYNQQNEAAVDVTSTTANTEGNWLMGNLLHFRPKRKNQFSLEFSRELPEMIEKVEQEYRFAPRTPAQQACFRDVHRGLAGLLDLQEDGGTS